LGTLEDIVEEYRGLLEANEAIRLDYLLDDFTVEKEECREISVDPLLYPFQSGDCVMRLEECRLTLRHREHDRLVLELEGLLIDLTGFYCEITVLYKRGYRITVETVEDQPHN
jgi:hypothetical protein